MINSFQNKIITELPDIAKIDFKNINRNYLKIILINFLLLFISLSIGLFFLIDKKLVNKIPAYIPLIYSAFFLIFILIFIFIIVGFPKRKYALRDKDIYYKSGVLTKTITTVPFSRIQHVEIDQGPISRFFGLSCLTVFTAGDSSHDLEIKGITNEQALQIKEFISTTINES